MIEQWKRLAAEKRRIECGMQACMKTLVGKRVRFQFGNMARPAEAEVLYADIDGERIRVKNIETGGMRRISPYHILPNASVSSSGDEPEYAPRTCSALSLAEQFHATYERLAPEYGYETRPETRVFDPASANGKLMIAVCQSIIQQNAN